MDVRGGSHQAGQGQRRPGERLWVWSPVRFRSYHPRRRYQVIPTLMMDQSRTVTLEKTLRKEGGKKVIDLNNTDRPVLHLTNQLKHPTRI